MRFRSPPAGPPAAGQSWPLPRARGRSSWSGWRPWTPHSMSHPTVVNFWFIWCFTSHAKIFQLYMWRHRRAGRLKKLFLWSGSHGHFVGFFNVPVPHRHGTTFLYSDSHTPPHLVAFYKTLGIQRTYSPTVDRNVPKIPWNGQMYLQGGGARQHLWRHSAAIGVTLP